MNTNGQVWKPGLRIDVIRPSGSQSFDVFQMVTSNPMCTGNRPVAHTPTVLDEAK